MDELFKVVTTPSGDGGTVTIFAREDTPDGFEFVPKVNVQLQPEARERILVQVEAAHGVDVEYTFDG